MTQIEPDGMTLSIRPVGIVRSPIQTPMLAANDDGLTLQKRMAEVRDYHKRVKETVAELVIGPWLIEALEGIEDFSHVMVIYWPHLIPPERRGLRRVHPMGRRDLPERGVFATCSPARPNPTLVSVVPLVERKGNVLRVRGLEAVDGSPIIDIKPYVHGYHGADESTVPEWMVRIHRELEAESPETDL